MLRTDEMNGPRVLTPLHTIFPHPRAPLHISWFHLCFSFSHLACKKKQKKTGLFKIRDPLVFHFCRFLGEWRRFCTAAAVDALEGWG